MSWSITASGTDRESTLRAFAAKARDEPHCPYPSLLIAAAERLGETFHKPYVTRIASSGHVESNGTGYASITINADAPAHEA
jgi:hypothetical protein